MYCIERFFLGNDVLVSNNNRRTATNKLIQVLLLSDRQNASSSSRNMHAVSFNIHLLLTPFGPIIERNTRSCCITRLALYTRKEKLGSSTTGTTGRNKNFLWLRPSATSLLVLYSLGRSACCIRY
jgi:hypothetical protein